MKLEEQAKHTLSTAKSVFSRLKRKAPRISILMLMLTVSILPVEALPARQDAGETLTPSLTIEVETPTETPTVMETPTLTPLPPDSLTPESTSTEPPPDTPTNTLTATDTAEPAPTTTNTPTGTVPVTATLTSIPTSTANVEATITLTFVATADARVAERYPADNYGSAPTLRANGIAGFRQNSYIRFTSSGINGTVQRATLRVFCTTNSTRNGPAVHLAKNDWLETGPGRINWNNQPALWSGAADNKMAIGLNSWVEYDVTPLVAGNGTYTFALVADSTDGVTFSSREGANPPQLVVTFAPGAPLVTPSPTPADTPTVSPEPNQQVTATEALPSPDSVTLVGAGDIATCWRNQDELTAQLLDNIPGTVFTTGDNAYIDGSYAEYINCYDPTWGRHKSRTKPSPGNHEYHTSGAAGYFQYFSDIPAHYAYNLGAWRIYSLNSEISVSDSSAQVTWLRDDLAANPHQCVLAYWHKPRWGSGSNHGSNSAMQALWETLYNAGAELVINGHEHNYERFAEMNASGAPVSRGLREIIVGTGGAGLYPFGTPLPASQVRNNTTYGVLKLTLRSTSYDWEFVPVSGSTFMDSGSAACH